MKRFVALAAVSILFLAACGSDSGSDVDPLAGSTQTTMGDMAGGDHMGNATGSCKPAGAALTLTASGTKFNTDCLAAPAGQAFTIAFDNKDNINHNIQILASHSASEAMFDAELIPGNGVKTLNVKALAPGTYAFHCKIHPGQMSGTFVVT